MVEWQTIDSAPKSGLEFIAYCHGLIRIVFWDKARGGCWSKWPGRAEVLPTHWMPLPKPPESGG